MTRYDGLMTEISKEFGIRQGKTETEINWKARILYSLLGRMSYASLSDHWESDSPDPDGQESISIQHFKKRVLSLLDSYLELYPELAPVFICNRQELCTEIYDIYLKTGCIYHTPYRTSPAILSAATHKNIQFERGTALNHHVCISGLGTYLQNQTPLSDAHFYSSVHEMFRLQPKPLPILWSDIISHAQWHPFRVSEDTVYFPSKPPFYDWRRDLVRELDISLARMGSQGGYLYFLCRKEGKEILGSQLPQWLIHDPHFGAASHRLVSNAYLAAYSCLPPIQYHLDGAIVSVQFRYLLPPAENYWVKLYSWPQAYSHFPSDFKRFFDISVFGAVKDILEQLGYQFMEV